MSIRHRPMRPKDVRECVEIVAAHPVVAPRYSNGLADLRTAWLRVLSSNGFCSAVVFEEIDDGAVRGRSRSRLLGMGVSVFVSDDFLRELKTRPSFWIGPELARRVVRGDSPLLSEKQVREANSGPGLNLAVWHSCISVEDAQRADVWSELMAAFMESHRGFRLNELSAQADSPQHLDGMRNTGGHLFNFADGCYGGLDEEDLSDVMFQPHIGGCTREIAQSQLGSWTGSLFLYEPPRFGFSRSEQRLLAASLAGGTDEELSDKLGVSLSTIKKMWRSVYRRVAVRNPELIPGDSQADGGSSKRGRSKKQRLMAYLREHLQELRPFSRKVLEQNAARTPAKFAN
jgi:DNA-binding CsgD family transcriptional regulator